MATISPKRGFSVATVANIFTGHWKCFPSSVARDGKDGHGLKLKNSGPILLLCLKKYQNISYKVWSLLFLISSS